MGSASEIKTSSPFDFASKAISVVSLGVAALAAWKALPLDEEIKRLQAETVRLENGLKKAEADLKAIESQRKLTIELYQEVRKVLERKEKDPREEEAVRVLVESLAEDPFRWKLLQALAAGAASAEVKKKAESTATFYRDETMLAAAPVQQALPPQAASKKAYGGYNIDFFHCESAGDSGKALAARAQALRDDSVTGRWRARLLPDEINAKTGYGIQGNLIRFNPDERMAADALIAELKAKLQVDVAGQEISYPTPNYVSVFFCG